jgi:hypothetical protein
MQADAVAAQQAAAQSEQRLLAAEQRLAEAKQRLADAELRATEAGTMNAALLARIDADGLKYEQDLEAAAAAHQQVWRVTFWTVTVHLPKLRLFNEYTAVAIYMYKLLMHISLHRGLCSCCAHTRVITSIHSNSVFNQVIHFRQLLCNDSILKQ